MMMIIIVSMCY